MGKGLTFPFEVNWLTYRTTDPSVVTWNRPPKRIRVMLMETDGRRHLVFKLIVPNVLTPLAVYVARAELELSRSPLSIVGLYRRSDRTTRPRLKIVTIIWVSCRTLHSRPPLEHFRPFRATNKRVLLTSMTLVRFRGRLGTF